MTTRLDRLFLLLDTGSSPLTRKTAAQQLGEVQKLHPHELPLLLGKVSDYLRSSSWETRIAAAQAVEAILSNVPQWEPLPVALSNGKMSNVATTGRLKFHQFSIEKILQNRSFLTASEGKEFDQDESHNNLNPRDRIAAQRQALNQKLGLDLASKLGIDTGDIFSNEDLEAPVVKLEPPLRIKIEVSEETATTLAQLSSREANRAKRKARLFGKQKSRDVSQEKVEEPSTKKMKKEKKSSVLLVDSVPDSDGSWPDSAQIWPFESLCDVLIADLFSLNWEYRHGAGTALREIVKLHGRGAGKTVDMTSEEMSTSHDLWLEDMSLRLLCVLALDRFGDFVSDQVVAPVRETCAQALGSVVNLMNKASVISVTQVLLQLLQQQEWEARHGGLLGLKYLMAIRQDLSQEILPLVYSCLFRGLQDPVDDVSAVAAAALVPMADNLVRLLPFEEVSILQITLWDSLLDLDELSGSTSSILSLLSSLVANPAMGQQLESLPLVDLVPRLWPFLNHSSSVVRKSTVKTLLTLLTPGHQVGWLPALATDFLRFVFQCALVEHTEDILVLIQQLWQLILQRLPLDSLLPAACPYVATWLCLLMQPSRVQFDPATLVFPEARDRATGSCNKPRQSSTGTTTDSDVHPETKLFIAGPDSMYENAAHREKGVVRARCLGAVMLGRLSRYLVEPMPGLVYTPEMESPLECYLKLLSVHLNSRTSIQRTVVAHVIAEWAAHDENTPGPLMEKIHQCLNEAVYYDEIALAYTRLLHEAKDYVATLKHYKLAIETVFPAASGNFLSLEQIQQLAGPVSLQLFASSKLKSKLAETLEERRRTLASSAVQVHNDQTALNNTTQAALARAMISFRYLPEKLNPVIKPLMDAIKTEENEQLQDIAARALANLIELCLTRNPCPNTKVIKNLCAFLCADPDFTPRILDGKDALRGIISLQQQQKEAERAAASKKQNSSEESQVLLIQRRGAKLALRAIVRRFGKELAAKVPVVWEQITVPLSSVNPETPLFKTDVSEVQDLVQRLQVFESTCTAVDSSLHDQLMGLLPALCALLQHPFSAVRHMVSRCLAALGSLDPTRVLTAAVERIIPMLGAVDCEQMRQGSMEALSCLVEQLGLGIIPFIVLLVIPVLGRMSDTEESVRVAATQCFATLIRLMPLEGGAPDPPTMSQQLAERKLRERKFLEQLFNPKKMENYQVSVPIKAELRSYQQEGVNWLAFLNKYKLHGILCDDMGLGKTLQTICIIASDHSDREREFAATKSPDAAPLPSVVVCPPTLTGHWVYEIEKFISSTYLKPLHYSGPPVERNRLRSRLPHHNIVVVSYDIVRNDLEFFSSVRWNYCVLDEGHIIKNGKTKASKAIKQLVANHRLILSGTPIQNNVLELWSLFDFLMPGFLGSEKQFQARYSKPILASRDAKASSKEQEAGALALESLHRQTLPFLLRRMKEDVLNDLPPKITQDYYCELSPLQVQLYEDFAKKHAQMDAGVTSSQTHIFQALQYLRKVCNHPKLVLTPQHPEYEKAMRQLKEQHSSLTDIQVASKLPALRQLLLDCGIGATNSSGNNITQQEFVVSQHRALIFCQLKSMLDIIEKDLLKQHMPTVSYLRLDGGVPAGSRHSVVKRFNEDPSIDVLLLTTQVGGLGLNLTGADTVIFVEHDWNPMKDLQAMDRAHRIGQKRVVNVYRLITKATLEEKIMGLQKFKLKTASAIISTENASLQSMGTDQLLDLFSLEDRKDSRGPSLETTEAGGAAGMPGGIRVALESLPELWNEEQYENEYNLDSFIASLKP